jgi:antitoxin ParD1/3/4
MARTSRPMTVTLGEFQERVEARVKSGRYASASEVLRAALRALDREETAFDHWFRQQIEETLADKRPSIPAAEVFRELREHHVSRLKKERDEAV